MKSARGFTLIELLVVIGLAGILVSLAMPLGITFYQRQTLQDSADSMTVILRRAHWQALSQKNDSSFGLKFFQNSYTLFQGNSYDSRTASEDEAFTLPSGASLSPLAEIVFAKETGNTSTQTLTLTLGSESEIISIDASGKIEKQ